MTPQGFRNVPSILLSALLISSLFVIANSSVSHASSTGSGEVAAASGSNRFVVWSDSTPGNEEIFFRRSTDDGATWQAIKNLSNNPGASHDPQIAVSGSNVYLVWYQHASDSNRVDIFFRRSTDNGATWKPVKNLSNDGCVGGGQRIAVSGANVYVTWIDCTPGDGTFEAEILFRRSTDSGATWQPKTNLSNNAGSSRGPEIAFSGSNVYVIWTDSSFGGYEVLFRRSTDNGATWKALKNLSNSSGPSEFPQIAVSGSNVYVAWHDAPSGAGDTFFRRSADNGATWKTIVNLSDNAGASYGLSITVSGSNVYVAWPGFTPDETETDIIFKRSTDNGATWKSSIDLSNNPGPSLHPQIALSGSNVYVVWEQHNTNLENPLSDVFFRRSTDNGATWKFVKNLSKTGQSYGPDLAVSASKVYVIWWAYPPGGSSETLLRLSTDNGATWGSAKNLSNNLGGSGPPQIAL